MMKYSLYLEFFSLLHRIIRHVVLIKYISTIFQLYANDNPQLLRLLCQNVVRNIWMRGKKENQKENEEKRCHAFELLGMTFKYENIVIFIYFGQMGKNAVTFWLCANWK